MALVIVLCALFLLCLLIFGLALRLGQDMYLTGRDNRSLDARALAYSGVQIALHPQVSQKTPALRKAVDATHRYEARLAGEGGKLNLNWLLSGDDPNRVALLKQYLEVRGLSSRIGKPWPTACSISCCRTRPRTRTAPRPPRTASRCQAGHSRIFPKCGGWRTAHR